MTMNFVIRALSNLHTQISDVQISFGHFSQILIGSGVGLNNYSIILGSVLRDLTLELQARCHVGR